MGRALVDSGGRCPDQPWDPVYGCVRLQEVSRVQEAALARITSHPRIPVAAPRAPGRRARVRLVGDYAPVIAEHASLRSWDGGCAAYWQLPYWESPYSQCWRGHCQATR